MDILYSAELSSNLTNYGTKAYKGICATTFKELLSNHKKSFNNGRYEADSALSKEVWKIKREGGEFYVKWNKDAAHKSYRPEGKRCHLCDNESWQLLYMIKRIFLTNAMRLYQDAVTGLNTS